MASPISLLSTADWPIRVTLAARDPSTAQVTVPAPVEDVKFSIVFRDNTTNAVVAELSTQDGTIVVYDASKGSILLLALLANRETQNITFNPGTRRGVIYGDLMAEDVAVENTFFDWRGRITAEVLQGS